MKSLRARFEQFCLQNQNKGIPNLIVYIALGNAIVYLLSIVTQNALLYDLLCFDRDLILQGQIWRLFTYAFIYHSGNTLFTALILFILCSMGRAAEMSIGTFKFNLYYLFGIVLQDIFSMIVGTPATINNLNYSFLLVFATRYPDFKVHLYFIIPIRAWVLVLVDFGITLYNVIVMRAFFPHNLFPLVAIVNYLLFFGRDVLNLFPNSWRRKAKKGFNKASVKKTGVTPLPSSIDYPPTPTKSQNYNHRCTVCGRTDTSHPGLEFRYCSRCNGYYCYCEDHINSHEHIE